MNTLLFIIYINNLPLIQIIINIQYMRMILLLHLQQKIKVI